MLWWWLVHFTYVKYHLVAVRGPSVLVHLPGLARSRRMQMRMKISLFLTIYLPRYVP